MKFKKFKDVKNFIPFLVYQEYKEAINSHICRTYTISFEELLNGVGVAKVNDGYF